MLFFNVVRVPVDTKPAADEDTPGELGAGRRVGGSIQGEISQDITLSEA